MSANSPTSCLSVLFVKSHGRELEKSSHRAPARGVRRSSRRVLIYLPGVLSFILQEAIHITQYNCTMRSKDCTEEGPDPPCLVQRVVAVVFLRLGPLLLTQASREMERVGSKGLCPTLHACCFC